MFGRAILARDAVQITGCVGGPRALREGAREGGSRSIIAVPLLRAGTPIGAIAMGRRAPGDYSATQVELLRTFAEQAVIAVSSAETYRELQERTAELARRNSEYGERIEQQSATIDVLKVMSSSPGDAQPVFELIARRALEFCDAAGARLTEFDGQLLHLRALVRVDGIETEADKALREQYPAPPDHDSIAGRVIFQRGIVHVRDVTELPFHGMLGRFAGSVLGVPLVREDRVIGSIVLSRPQIGGFTETQIELLQTFAEQAVIAIRSAETYRELQARTAALAQRNSEYGERIEQQAATIDVLKVMSASPGDAQPVFDLIVERARCFCGADHATTALLQDDMLHLQAYSGMSAAYGAEYAAQFPRPVDMSSMFGRAILSRKVMQTRNLRADLDHFANQMHTVGFSFHRRSAPPARRHTRRGDRSRTTGAGRLHRQPGRAAANLRRAGGDCDHQRRNLLGAPEPHCGADALRC